MDLKPPSACFLILLSERTEPKAEPQEDLLGSSMGPWQAVPDQPQLLMRKESFQVSRLQTQCQSWEGSCDRLTI